MKYNNIYLAYKLSINKALTGFGINEQPSKSNEIKYILNYKT